jgi:MFS family permease
MLMKAVCKNVQTYAAAAVFYWVGHTGFGYIMDVFIADMTTLRNRGIIIGINSTPSLATIFAGPAIAQDFLEKSNFRWAFGSFCIIMPVVAAPVAISFWINGRKAKKLGMAPERTSERTWTQSIYHYVVQFDRTYHAVFDVRC